MEICENEAELYRFMVEKHEKWRDIMLEMPYIQLKPEWLIRIIPPFAGAIARFHITLKDNPIAHVSVYLDYYGRLGAVNTPYWEVFPLNGDVGRCDMHDTDDLIKMIGQSLNEQFPGDN